ncbi:hypothetical protein [Portibacter lacus]|uniref:hypothetical protein n=1 Tax=Portibacter lacus TaxID=1099794 RepID=UPI001F33913C|nr:hypothetical protein [Portibacter lacus]
MDDGVQAEVTIWRKELKIKDFAKGRKLRIETVSPAFIKWTKDDWKTVNEVDTEDMCLGIHYTDLPTESMEEGQLKFTIYWKESEKWDGKNYEVNIV